MKKEKVLLVLFLGLVFYLAGCSAPAVSNEASSYDANTIGIQVKLPGGISKVAYGPDDAALYKIEMSLNDIVVQSKSGAPGDTIILTVDKEGKYSVSVFAYDIDNDEIAKGSVTTDLKFGKGIIPLQIRIKGYQKTIEIQPEIIWETEEKVMSVITSPDGEGLQITINEMPEEYDSIRFNVCTDDEDYWCYLNYDVSYPVTFYYPFTEDGKEYTIMYYAQTDGTKENRTIYTETVKCTANGGVGKLTPDFTGDDFTLTAIHDENGLVTATIDYIGNDSMPSGSVLNPLVRSVFYTLEVGKGTNDWGPLTVYKCGCSYDLTEAFTNGINLVVEGIETGDTYFVQSYKTFILLDEQKYPFSIRTIGMQSDNLVW